MQMMTQKRLGQQGEGYAIFQTRMEKTRLVSTPVLRTEAKCKAYQGVGNSKVEGEVARYDGD